MQAIQPASSGDIFARFNVGGRRFTTSLASLESKGPNMLVTLLDYQRTGKLPVLTDSKGFIFIDRDPDVFQALLGFLRTGNLEVPPNVSVQHLLEDFDYYQIAKPKHFQSHQHVYQEAIEKWRELAEYFIKNYGESILEHITHQAREGQCDINVYIDKYTSARTTYFILEFQKIDTKKEVQLLSKFYYWMDSPMFRREVEKAYAFRGTKLTMHKLDEKNAQGEANRWCLTFSVYS